LHSKQKMLWAQKGIIKIIFNKPKTISTFKLFEEFEFFPIQQYCSIETLYKFNLINFKLRYYNTWQKYNLNSSTIPILFININSVLLQVDLNLKLIIYQYKSLKVNLILIISFS